MAESGGRITKKAKNWLKNRKPTTKQGPALEKASRKE